MSSSQLHSQPPNYSSTELESPPPSFGTTGDEILPPYANHILLASLCRRKREFQAAFDKTTRGRRTWELVWLVLDGTALRLYRPKSQEKKAVENTDLGGGLGLGLGLVRTGSGDSTRSTPTSSTVLPFVRLGGRAGVILDHQIASGVPGPLSSAPLVSASESQLQLTRSRDSQGVVDSSAPSPLIEGQAQARLAGRGYRRMDSITKIAPFEPPAYPLHSMAAPYPDSASNPFLTSPPTPASAPRFVQPALPNFSRRKACRQYHLQHAICMRADAYTKREHVLRFILEDGKQFIVQLSSHAETISWLQLMSIAAPLSLDLDERPMPEPAHYPRRRPRTRTQRRPSTAPGALEPSFSTLITTTTTQATGTQTQGAQDDPVVDSTVVGGVEREGEEEDDDDADGDPLIVEEDMDHLPPPRRPVLLRSLSSVEQARRRGIQL